MEKEGYFNFQTNLFAQIILTSFLFYFGQKNPEFIEIDF